MRGLLYELMEICHILNTRMYPVLVSESSNLNIFLNIKGAQKETSSPHTIHKIG
jgi:methionyl-tRNA synthetase